MHHPCQWPNIQHFHGYIILEHCLGGKTLVEPRNASIWKSKQQDTEYLSNDAKWIWNYDCVHGNTSLCIDEEVLFEFSFEHVENPDNAPSFYVEWDSTMGDYIRFGIYNGSGLGMQYSENTNLILEAGYISNVFSYDIRYDGNFGYHQKIEIRDIEFAIANDSYNEDWWVMIDIVNTTDPKPCFGSDILTDSATRITARQLDTFALWRDDGRAMNWKSNGNTLPGWHSIQYLNTSDNSTEDRLLSFPYFLHYPFTASQQTWQRAFYIDSDIEYNYTQIEFDIYTFCGWDPTTDSISVSLAFAEYLEFGHSFWSSTHTAANCEGYLSPAWNEVTSMVRKNNGTHSELQCYAQNMESPTYQCELKLNTRSLIRNESVPLIVDCISLQNAGNLTLRYWENDTVSEQTESGLGSVHNVFNGVNRNSKLWIDVLYTDRSITGGLKCNITVKDKNESMFYTNTSRHYWSVLHANNNERDVVNRNESEEFFDDRAVWIWNSNLSTIGDYIAVVACIADDEMDISYAANGRLFEPIGSSKPLANASGIAGYFTKLTTVKKTAKLRISVHNVNASAGLRCVIRSGSNVAGTSTDSTYWSISSATNTNATIQSKLDGMHTIENVSISDGIHNIKNELNLLFNISNAIASISEFLVFIQDFNITYFNSQQVNITNNTNVTQIDFKATELTTCSLKIEGYPRNDSRIQISDGTHISSSPSVNSTFDIGLANWTNSSVVDHMIIELRPFEYHCRLNLYSKCNFQGAAQYIASDTKITATVGTSSWRLYARRGYECTATFYNTSSNATYTHVVNAEDGGMVSESCNPYATFRAVDISHTSVHYGCSTHVRFQAPNTNSEPFVLRIAADIDDISTKFGSYTKSWAFGNLSITPLSCSAFSNIVPLMHPITLSWRNQSNQSVLYDAQELASMQFDYLYLLLTFNNVTDSIEVNIAFDEYTTNVFDFENEIGYGDSAYLHIYMTESECSLNNSKLEQEIDCSNISTYLEFVDNVMNSSNGNAPQQLLWMSWDPYSALLSNRMFSFGFGETLNQSTVAAVDIFSNASNNTNRDYLGYMALIPPRSNSSGELTVNVVQFTGPKICLSQLAETNNINLGDVWNDDCAAGGWQHSDKAHIVNDAIHVDGFELVQQCSITNLNENPITKLATDCFHGPFKGTEPQNYGDYVTRYFHVLENVEFDIIEVNLSYYGLCTWNPEQTENDTAFVYVNHEPQWKSAPQYEFVESYCQGYGLYPDWILVTEYEEVLTADHIQCLYLLDQICAYPVSFTFRHSKDNELFFSVGLAAQLNQKINNEAFGFSHVSLRYLTCPESEPSPIGNITYQPLQDLNARFRDGDMLVISSSSNYYLLATTADDGNCTFTLYGGYKMWSEESRNCTIAGLPIMEHYPPQRYDRDTTTIETLSATFDLGISDDGVLFLQLHSTEKRVWSRRTRCEVDEAYYYYSMKRTDSLGYFADTFDEALFSLDCKWALVMECNGPLIVMNDIKVNLTDDWWSGTETNWTRAQDVQTLLFDVNGSLTLTDEKIGEISLSPEGGDYLVFDAGKLLIFDYDTDSILKQYDFEFANCTLHPNIGSIKYFAFMQRGDVLWNDEAVMSANCKYALLLKDGALNIWNVTDGTQQIVWNAPITPSGGTTLAEQLQFRTDGNLVLLPYSSQQHPLWQTETATIFSSVGSIFYADKAILSDEGHLFVMDSTTFGVQYASNTTNASSDQHNIRNAHNAHMDCDDERYDYVDKRRGFYATWISYFNCEDNVYAVDKQLTSCVDYKYCPVVQQYENVFLQPSSAQTNCRLYADDSWREITNNYILFQVSIANTLEVAEPVLYLVLSDRKNVTFGEPTSALSDRSLVIQVAVSTRTVTLSNANHSASFSIPSLFNNSKIEWFWLEWDANFDKITLGNSEFIGTTVVESTKYSYFFSNTKLDRGEHLFNYFNLAWDAEIGRCYGQIIVQLPPLNVETAKGCYENFTKTYQKPPRTMIETLIVTDSMTTSDPTTADPTTANPTTVNPTTADPTTADPTTSFVIWSSTELLSNRSSTEQTEETSTEPIGEAESTRSRLSGGIIAAIVIAALLALAVLGAVAWFVNKQKAGKVSEQAVADANANASAKPEKVDAADSPQVQMTDIVLSGAEPATTAQGTGDVETEDVHENETKEEEEADTDDALPALAGKRSTSM